MKRATMMTIAILSVLPVGLLVDAQTKGRRPPPAAYEACEGLSEGDRCSVQTPLGRLEGVCELMSEGDALACLPDAFRDKADE